jgi:thiamine biosynthesis lipoprotein
MIEPPSLVHRAAHQAMGTIYEVTIAGEDGPYAAEAARAVFREIDRLETLLSRFNPCSEISRINRLMPGESLAIGIETYECLFLGERMRAETEGAFDINVRGGFRGESRRLPLDLIQTEGRFEARFIPEGSAGAKDLDLDLGGIGKGYALDLSLAVLADWSIENALVHGGTSTAIGIGAAPDQAAGWPVGVGGGWPGADTPRRILLSGRAVSGSGIEVKGQHILDPRTGRPAEGHIAAWASHPSGAVADALSTAFMVMSTGNVEQYCRNHPEVWALVVRDYGNCRAFGKKVNKF